MIRRCHLDLAALYSRDPSGAYYYQFGVNARAMVAVGVAVLPCLPHFVAQFAVVGPHVHSVAADQSIWARMYASSWFVSCGLGAALYLLLAACLGPADTTTDTRASPLLVADGRRARLTQHAASTAPSPHNTSKAIAIAPGH